MKISVHSFKKALRYVLAVLAGLLLTLAFPKWDMEGAAWVAPALMLFSAMGVSGKKAFWLGFLAGFAHFLTSLYWLLLIPYTFHGIPLGPAAGWLSLSAYSALFPAFWVWICWKIFPSQSDPSKTGKKPVCMPQTMPWTQKAFWCLACGLAWVALELLRAHFLSGFPWNLLGNSQYKLLPLIQIASVGGVYVISFLVVWTSVAIGTALISIVPLAKPKHDPQTPQSSEVLTPVSGTLLKDVILPILAVAAVISSGAEKVFQKSTPKAEVKVALIQPSIPQTVIWDPGGDAARFDKVMAISKEALTNTKPDVLIWPESALPGFTETTYTALTNLVIKHGVWMILCADDRDDPAAPGEAVKYYNSSFLLSPQGKLVDTYRKRRLVIFGEYIPLAKWLPFLKWFTPIEGGFTPGPGPVQFALGKTMAKTSSLICFEDVFPHEARDHVNPDTDFLLNLTNDGWFGEGSCQWQQAASGVMRAVENGVPLVRCTNNGITCWIDAQGRIRAVGPDNVYGPGYLTVSVPLRDTGTQTFYNRHGDIFAWICAVITVFLLSLSVFRSKFQAIK